MKLYQLHEQLDPKSAARRFSYVTKTAPSDREIGFIGHAPGKRFSGDKSKVQIKFDPSDPEIQKAYVYHTHPYGPEGPSALGSLPSEQDLVSAVENSQRGLMGLVIYNGPFYTVVVPTDRVKDDFTSYAQAIKRHDIEDAVKALDRAGFDVETGKL